MTLDRNCIKPQDERRPTLCSYGGLPVEDAAGPARAVLLHICRIGWTDRGTMTMRDNEDEIAFGVPILVGFTTADDSPRMMRFDQFSQEVAMALVGPVDPSTNRRFATMGVIYRITPDGTTEVTALACDEFRVDSEDRETLTVAYGCPGYEITMTRIEATLALGTTTL